MYGMNPDGWLAAHQVTHRELIERARQSAQRSPREERRVPAPQAPAIRPAAQVCC